MRRLKIEVRGIKMEEELDAVFWAGLAAFLVFVAAVAALALLFAKELEAGGENARQMAMMMSSGGGPIILALGGLAVSFPIVITLSSFGLFGKLEAIFNH